MVLFEISDFFVTESSTTPKNSKIAVLGFYCPMLGFWGPKKWNSLTSKTPQIAIIAK